jgi:predicted dehydrogenase
MKVLIIGLGSIAKKHIPAIWKTEPQAEIYALRTGINKENYEKVINVYDWQIAKEVDFILISNPTHLHEETILKSLEFNKPLFIEKPVLFELSNSGLMIEKIKQNNLRTYVACVLRFHPVIVHLKKLIESNQNEVEEVNVYCGSYLPDWRPDSDFRKSYSTQKENGGGVHLDLIHEIDYLYWIFGKPKEVKSTLRSRSHLNIDAIDYASYQLIYPRFVANVILNYYRKQAKREIEVLGKDFIYKGDLLDYTLTEELTSKSIFNQNTKEYSLYDLQMQYFIDNLKSKRVYENDAETGIEVLKVVLNKEYDIKR